MIEKALEQVKLKRKENLENLQKEGLAILKLKEKLEKANIDFTFIDHKKERIEHADHESIERIKRETPFDLQILIMEDGKKISLIQSPFSYGIMNNLIEIYNFNQEPITLWYTDAFKFIKHKYLNDYICYANKAFYADTGEDQKQMREELHKFIKIIMESEDN